MIPLKNAQFCVQVQGRRSASGGSRIALKVSADASLRVTKVPQFEPDTEIGQISADFERGCFAKVS